MISGRELIERTVAGRREHIMAIDAIVAFLKPQIEAEMLRVADTGDNAVTLTYKHKNDPVISLAVYPKWASDCVRREVLIKISDYLGEIDGVYASSDPDRVDSASGDTYCQLYISWDVPRQRAETAIDGSGTGRGDLHPVVGQPTREWIEAAPRGEPWGEV